jgi:nucleotide-binding universal stress UspA family protein
MDMNTQYQNILLAVDGSKEAEYAFKKAITIALQNNAHLKICHVIDTSIMTTTTFDSISLTVSESMLDYGKKLVSNYVDLAKEQGVKNVSGLIEQGNPKTIISKIIAPKHNIDLIICGATGLNTIERLLIGSVSEHIIRYASCDVLVIRNNND